jgi:hypothetical protein
MGIRAAKAHHNSVLYRAARRSVDVSENKLTWKLDRSLLLSYSLKFAARNAPTLSFGLGFVFLSLQTISQIPHSPRAVDFVSLLAAPALQ